jgi:hypothetical protein
MSFIPGEGTNVFPLDSANGRGISLTQVGPTTYVATDLVAGPNITLTPNFTNKTITIASPAGPAGIGSVQTTNGSGINETTILPNIVQLSSALQAGAGIGLNPSLTTKDLTINNTATLTAGLGSGITLTGAGPSYGIEAALIGGAGISVAPDPLTQNKTIVNTGVLSLNTPANSGISISAPTGNITISNTNPVPVAQQTGGGIAVGVGQVVSLDLTAGTGVQINNTGGTTKQIVNTGALSVQATTGIGVSSTTGNITITNNGVRTLAVNAPLTTTGGFNPTIGLGPLSGGLKVSRVNVQASYTNFPIPSGQTGKILFQAAVGSAMAADFTGATPIADANGTWVVNLSSFILNYPTNAPASQSISMAIEQGSSTILPPAYNLPTLLFATGSTYQFLTPGQIALPVNAIKGTLGALTAPILGLTFTNGLAGAITQGSRNSVVYAVYYPNGVQ